MDVRLPFEGSTAMTDVLVVGAAAGGLATAEVLATGAHPRRLPGAHDAYALRSLDDALSVRAALGPGRRLVVVGDGVLGTEIAATAAQLATGETLAADAVAANILGAARAYTPVPYFWTHQFDARIHVYGVPVPGAEFAVLDGDPATGRFVAVYHHGGRPVAVLGWNMPKQARLRKSVLSFEEGKNGDDLPDDQGEGVPVRSAAGAG
jgi:hypothetical protein